MSRRFVRSLPNLADSPGRVLVCEDSDELRALLVSRLANTGGVEVVGAVADSASALEAIERLRPDAILLDLMIGDTDPNDMLQTLATIDGRPLVIVFSGLDPGELAPEARRTIDLHLDKTTPLRRVTEFVAETIAAHREGERL